MHNFLKERRKELGLTMLQVANEVGVSEATVSRWESGDIANMRRDRILRLARALSVNPSAVIGLEDEPTTIFSPREQKVIEAYRTNPQVQQIVDVLLDSAKENAAPSDEQFIEK